MPAWFIRISYMDIKKERWIYWLTWLLFAVIAMGCFLNLGGRNFGVDEAETAVLGENILTYGIPMAWNGRGLIDNVTANINGINLNDDLVYTSHPWFPYYYSALLISVFGKNHFWLRAGFAWLGFAGLILFYFLVKKLGDRKLALLALIIAALNVHYYLFIRSFRHYPLNVFFAMLAIYGYFFLEKRQGKFCLILGLTLLYHTNYIPFLDVYVALAVMVLLDWNWPRVKTFIACSLLVFLFTFPAFLYLETYKFIGSFGTERYSNPLLNYAGFMRDINNRFVPLILFIAYAGWLFFQRKSLKQYKHDKAQQLKIFCFIYPLCSILIEPLIIPEILLRNAVPIMLFLSLAAAYLLLALFQRSKLWAIVLAIVLLFTNLLSEMVYYPAAIVFEKYKPGLYKRYVNELKTHPWRVVLKAEPYYFIQELYTPFYSSQQAIIEFLTEHAQAEDIVYYYSDEARALQFYTNFRLAYQVHKDSPFRYKFSSLPAWATTDEYFDWFIPTNEGEKQHMLARIRRQGGSYIRYELEPMFLSHWDLPFEHLFIPYVQDCQLHYNPEKKLSKTEVYHILWNDPPVGDPPAGNPPATEVDNG